MSSGFGKFSNYLLLVHFCCNKCLFISVFLSATINKYSYKMFQWKILFLATINTYIMFDNIAQHIVGFIWKKGNNMTPHRNNNE